MPFCCCCAAPRPTNLGVGPDGKLAPPPSSPNCVSSMAAPSDAEHSIAPITFSGDAATAWGALKTALIGMPRLTVARARSLVFMLFIVILPLRLLARQRATYTWSSSRLVAALLMTRSSKWTRQVHARCRRSHLDAN